jgi:outer membrane protein assembly factor BamB
MDRIVARDLTRPRWKLVSDRLHLYPEGTRIRRLEFPVLWEMRSPLRVMIKAGDRLFAGGNGTIAAISIPETGQEPAIAWESAVDGNPASAIAASGCLVVTTDTGKLYCFGTGPRPDGAPSRTTAMPEQEVPAKGYALCLGTDAEEKARKLVDAGEYRVVLLEPDAGQAAAIRQRLSNTGIDSDRMQVIRYKPEIQITPYWADLVVVGSLATFGSTAEKTLDTALDSLRPFTGRLEFSGDVQSRDLLKGLTANRDGYELLTEPERSIVRRTAPPTGSAQWTHEAGGPGNTFSSSEQLVRWPLATLWYSGEIDRFFTPATHFQHERNPYPLVSRGRMFIITHEYLHAIDIYTGRYLWKAEMPKTPWVEARYHDSRIYGRPVDRNYVATDDAVYVILEEEIHVYSAADGAKTSVLRFPEGMGNEIFQSRWTEVRIDGDMLFAVLDDTLVALDRHTGELIWQRKSKLGSTTFAIGGGRVIGLDFTSTEVGGRGRPATVRGPLFVLGARTGQGVRRIRPSATLPSQALVRGPRP